jgi:hypothetical protein
MIGFLGDTTSTTTNKTAKSIRIRIEDRRGIVCQDIAPEIKVQSVWYAQA